MRCRVCGNKLVPLETVEAFPGGVCFEHTPFELKKQALPLYKCVCCTHVQCESPLSDDYYNSYNEYAGSEQYFGALKFTRGKLEKLKRYARTNSTFLDIGCGTGEALLTASEFFARCIGVEPAYNTYNIAKRQGLNVINAYFSKELRLAEQLSAFAAFQVFEHLSDVYEVLDYAFDLLEPGGVGLINVPNGQEIMDESLYYEVVQEHINYFTPYSISQMAHNAGFEIIEIEDVPQTVELDIYVKKPMRGIGFYQHLHTLREALAQMLASYRSVVAWGAGAKSAKYANLLGDPSLIERLIDSDVKKIGMYVPGVNCPIELATAEAVRESPAVIIFASSYNTEIIERLRGDFGYVGDIIFFQDGRNVKVLKCD